jgi:hypothetical protein
MNFGQEWYSKLFLSAGVLLLYTVYIFFGRKKAIEIQKNRTNEIPLMIGRSWFSF